MEEGFQFALKERAGVIAGRKIEVYAISDYVRQAETPMDDPAAFLAAPVYSRDYPPAKNLE